jgi:hypothetical protein
MKIITPNLIKFTVTATILTLLFRVSLSYGIAHTSNIITILAALLYTVAMFITGWTFGNKDRAYLPIYDVGFRFHLATYLVHNTLSELWFIFNGNAQQEQIITVHSTAVIWGIFLIGHFIFFLLSRKNAIGYLNKEDVFD